ncbi:class I SAM-dependent RNA methyltransferase [Iamia sp. SCSIO 61187]|uniref:class I SAM-dependent RNA methyltransferase n=1 Tax=Iamia sp. SCSIO 61187 TaxID=2722752 RepID=UPI001C629B72|nr:TRAM domain-containing protein [Iamia sp. SCSIO 61187]QYG93647.1 class I SAM-dependent RNA methyltransferase [Iamia sp. SCSIO 61187]
MDDAVEVDVVRVATGGEGVGRAPDGRTLFVAGALPGERVRATVLEVRKRHGRAELVDVVHAAPGRRPPPCPHVADGCGGCDWQHATDELQAAMRRTIVTDALVRIGRIAEPVVEDGTTLPADARRTTIRAAVVDGRAGYRRRRSHDVIAPGICMVVHPHLEELLVDGRFGAATEVLLRVGARTGDRVAVVAPTAADVDLPGAVDVLGDDDVERGERGAIHEEAGGRRWRVSARSFFQPSPEAADALVEEVRDAVGERSAGGRLVDLASGVGLFAGTVGGAFDEVVAVESAPTAVADAEVNLADRPVRIVRSTIERWAPEPADVVVADPPRAGLGRVGVERVVATGARVVVLVSCDAAALGRDAGLLVAAGFRLERSRVLDLFPQTAHVEVVSRFVR